jgi:hypothetical protein
MPKYVLQIDHRHFTSPEFLGMVQPEEEDSMKKMVLEIPAGTHVFMLEATIKAYLPGTLSWLENGHTEVRTVENSGRS